MSKKEITKLKKEIADLEEDVWHQDREIGILRLGVFVFCILLIAGVVFYAVDTHNKDTCGKEVVKRLSPTEFCNLNSFESADVLDSDSNKFKCYTYNRVDRAYVHADKIYDVRGANMILSREKKVCN